MAICVTNSVRVTCLFISRLEMPPGWSHPPPWALLFLSSPIKRFQLADAQLDQVLVAHAIPRGLNSSTWQTDKPTVHTPTSSADLSSGP